MFHRKKCSSIPGSCFCPMLAFAKRNLINFEDRVQKYRDSGGKYRFLDAIAIRGASLFATDSFPSTGRARTAVTLFVGPLEQGPFMAQVTGRERLAPQREYANLHERGREGERGRETESTVLTSRASARITEQLLPSDTRERIVTLRVSISPRRGNSLPRNNADARTRKD